MEIYFDNAATTPVDSTVLKEILPYLSNFYGNASSGHWAGRKVREAIDTARETIASLLGAFPEEIFFTSGATEANNMILGGAIRTYGITHVVTSRIEHKAVLQTLAHFERDGDVEVSFVNLDDYGNVDLRHLEALLDANPRTLVSLMHGNNEVGNLTDLDEAGALIEKYDGLFHSDTTQTMGKEPFDLEASKVDFLVGSSHKFHGPKGAGFAYIRRSHKIVPHIFGGAQERGQRGGTENVAGIVGLAKALELSYALREQTTQHVADLKNYLLERLNDLTIAGINYNGESRSATKSLANILNVAFPLLSQGSLVNRLDQLGVAVSGGSACSNLVIGGSHVINTLYPKENKENVRFSFSKYNTRDQIDYVIRSIVRIYQEDSEIQAHEADFRQALRKVS